MASVVAETPMRQNFTSSISSRSRDRVTPAQLDSLIRLKVQANQINILNALRAQDGNQSGRVSPEQLAKVLQQHCSISLSPDQLSLLLSKLGHSGQVNYLEFLAQYSLDPLPATPTTQPLNVTQSDMQERPLTHASSLSLSAPSQSQSQVRVPAISRSTSSALAQITSSPNKETINVDAIERLIREKVGNEVNQLVKALRLYDFNRDGKIQMKDLRNVLEQQGIKLSDIQFEKLWQRYDYMHSGRLDFTDFLRRLGILRDSRPRSTSQGLNWERSSAVPVIGEKSRPMSVMTVPAPHPSSSVGRASHVSRLLDSQAREGRATEALNFEELELKFREKIKSEMALLHRALIVCDPSNDGIVDISQLRAVISQFVMPLSDQQFNQLMLQVGVKATGRVPWKLVLAHFQSPLSEHLANSKGQTLPIPNNSHHYNPVRGSGESATLDQLVGLLRKHIEIAYGPSLRLAFLQLDPNRSGKLSRAALRQVIENFKFKITDAQFAELMRYLDPDGTNTISYKKFLDLFEFKEELQTGHKWLKSTHRFNDKTKAIRLAWATIEDLLGEKISLHWREISRAFSEMDYEREGLLPPEKIRRVIEHEAFSISDDHFNFMIGKLNNRDDRGRASYIELMERLGVNMGPRDTAGVSAKIIDGSNEAEEKRLADQAERNSHLLAAVSTRANQMEPEEVIVRLKDRMNQHSASFADAFLAFSQGTQGKITKRNFRRMLHRLGMSLSDESFDRLCTVLNFSIRGMSYIEFLVAFQDVQLNNSIAADIERHPNHKWNAVRGDEFGMSADSIVRKIHDKIRENFTDLRSAFYKYDPERKGFLTREAFRRLLDSFMFLSNEDEFEKVAAQFNLSVKGSRLSYKEWLAHFEVHDSEEGHKWLNSQHRYNKVRDSLSVSAEEASRLLREKAHQYFKSLSQAIIRLDRSGKGRITRPILREILHTFMIVMDAEEFERLWCMLDTAGDGYLLHGEFLSKLGIAKQFTPGDDEGTSKRIVKENISTLKQHMDSQQMKHDQMTKAQARTGEMLSVEEVLKRLRHRIRDAFGDLFAVFRRYDTERHGFLTAKEIRSVLRDLYLYVSEEQLEEILARFGISATGGGRISYVEFLNAVHDEPTLAPSRLAAQVTQRTVSANSLPPRIEPHALENLSNDAAEKLAREHIRANVDTLLKACQSVDTSMSRRLSIGSFKRVVSAFALPLTDGQMRYLLSKMAHHLSKDGKQVSYLDLLDELSEERNPLEAAGIRPPSRAAPVIAAADFFGGALSAEAGNKIIARREQFTRILEASDYAKIGVVALEDFGRILNDLGIDDATISNLKKSGNLPMNGFGNVDYREFLRRLTSHSQPASDERPATALSSISQVTSVTSVGLNIPETIDENEPLDILVEAEAGDTLPPALAAIAPPVAPTPAPPPPASDEEGTKLPPLPTSRTARAQSRSSFEAPVGPAASLELERPMSQMANAENIERRLRKYIKVLQAQFRMRDINNTGIVTFAQFAEILNGLGLRLSRAELQLISRKYSSGDDLSSMQYSSLLRNLVQLERPQSRQQNLMARKKLHSGRIPSMTGDSDRSAQFEETMLRLRELVLREWKELGRTFRELDPSRSGSVDTDRFRRALDTHHVLLSDDEFFHLVSYYDPQLRGHIPYNTFLRAFLETA